MERVFSFHRIICILIISTLAAAEPLYAELDDFGQEVEEEQEKGPDDRKKPKLPKNDDPPAESEPNYPDSDDQYPMSQEEAEEAAEGMAIGIAIMFPILIIAGWFIHNTSSYYPEYPYHSPGVEPFSVAHDQEEPIFGMNKRNRASFSAAGGFFIEGGDIGATASFQATSMFLGTIGPEVGYRWWGDSSGSLHYLRLGGRFPIIQTNPFTLSSPMACAMFFDAFDLIGFAVGGHIESYPVFPLSLEFMGGAIIAPELVMAEFGGGIGYHFHRFEFTAGYYGLYHSGRTIHSVDLALAVHM